MMVYVGIDVSKYHLDVYGLAQSFRITNDEIGLKKLSVFLKKNESLEQKTFCIVCEPTGGYEKALLKQMKMSGYSTHLAHANKIRAFAKSKGTLAKTDAMDAKLIYDYAHTLNISPDVQLLSENAEKIRELLKRREQLQTDRRREKTRLDKESLATIKHSIKSHINWLDHEIESLDKQLEQETQEDESLHASVALLTSIPTVGTFTALSLLAFLPELGKGQSASLTALAGLAPFNRDSGDFQGKRFIQGGRAIVRKALYMAAVASLRWNPDCDRFYQHLRAKGKAAKVALVAVMRKLLLMANSVLKRQTPWRENLITQA